MVQAEGLDAVFECQSSGQLSAVVWFLNEFELSLNNPPPGIRIDNQLLTIPATAMNNGSVVRCRAVSGAGILDSPNATLSFLVSSIALVLL